MGVELSKLEQPSCSSNKARKNLSDDGQSKATASTDDSLTIPPSPLGMSLHSSLHGASQDREVSEVMRQAQVLTNNHDLSRRHNHHLGPQYNSAGAGTISLQPQQQQPSRRGASAPYDQQMAASHEDSCQYLSRLYDQRTWEMFRRITQYRKETGQTCEEDESPAEPPATELNDEWENLQQEVTDGGESEHEMVFLFDFD